MEKKFFFDSYAIIELNEGNENYKRYLEEDIITSVLNIGEVYYHYLKYYDKRTAEYWHKKIFTHILEITEEVMNEAMELKFHHKKSKLSMVDCVGYILAKKHNLNFLTGDKEFKDLPNVEFVKKEEAE